MSIEVKGVLKKFGDFTALEQINFAVKTGELVALLGPSGSGKTTLLRVIAGLEEAEEGQVLIHGVNTTDQQIKERRVGFVFQHYALFRHMTVFENVAFGLRVTPKKDRPKESEIQRTVLKLLNLVRLEGLAKRYPSQLSGGQRQRVALARALAIKPKMLLLDEPFGSLDAKVRKELRQWLRELHDQLHMTSLFVTHDQEEALEVADRIIVMNAGKIEQIGTPDEVYHRPASPFVYHFLGNVNLFHGRSDGDKIYLGNTTIELEGGSAAAGPSAQIYIRPHLLDIDRKPQAQSFRARIQHINAAGPTVRLELVSEEASGVIHAEIPIERFQVLQLKRNEEVYVTPKKMDAFPTDYSI